MKKRPRHGWSLLELMIVVTIIGILAALAVPLFRIIVKKSRFSTLANDLRQHSQSIQRWTMEMGYYPEDFTDPATILDAASGSRLDQFVGPTWSEPTAIGGAYSFIYTNNSDPDKRSAYIQITETGAKPFSINVADVKYLDERIDDGNLSTGFLQVAPPNRIRYYVKLPSN